MRLIDADALKTEINFTVTITGKDNAAEVKRLMELYNKAISNAPTINTVPMKYGKNISENGFLCSVCSFGDFGGFHGYEPNYCPNCGAKMKGQEE